MRPSTPEFLHEEFTGAGGVCFDANDVIFDLFYSIQQLATFELLVAGVVGKAVGQRRYSRSLFQRYSLTDLCCSMVYIYFSVSTLRDGDSDGKAGQIIQSRPHAIRLASPGSQSANEMLPNWVCECCALSVTRMALSKGPMRITPSDSSSKR